MKNNIKKITLLIILMIIFSGCETGSLKCKNSYDDYTVEIKATVDNKKIKNATARMKFKSRNDASNMCNLKKLSTNDKVNIICYEKEVVIKNYQYLESSADKKITKSDFVNSLKKQGFKC